MEAKLWNQIHWRWDENIRALNSLNAFRLHEQAKKKYGKSMTITAMRRANDKNLKSNFQIEKKEKNFPIHSLAIFSFHFFFFLPQKEMNTQKDIVQVAFAQAIFSEKRETLTEEEKINGMNNRKR